MMVIASALLLCSWIHLNAQVIGIDYADFDGDGIVDPTRINRATGEWWITSGKTGKHGIPHIPWGWKWRGQTVNEVVVCRDYDNDGTDDLALMRPSDGKWYIIGSKTMTPVGVPGTEWGSTHAPIALYCGKLLSLYARDGKTTFVALQRGSVAIYNNDGSNTNSGAVLSLVPGQYYVLEDGQGFSCR